ncbi:hypothetical protein ANOM_000259 [Aspergillus nomiae NRRL 13137]|uniref:Endosomal SPRY domain protein n=1 Tax=Aspergillus nomiae NRRL (strain ATCC 15546 / NRRL 13137 / CBS 260.88 / M93) TaxID=1509407 RepID=A0A0L1JJW6_ASPN3|nr:uncharacterized protein ANOM_000259 [Aspergillus nomiae NRRL 13137]KNG91713.1 hypothetical protein ANOM_000259 [Aspergillus nomiae NRRL 13137]
MPPVIQVGNDFPSIPTPDNNDVLREIQPSPEVEALTERSVTASLAEKPHSLVARDGSSKYIPGDGAVDPHKINMQGLLALFALIGAAFVLAAIWFFFWAKNGGFIWRKGDWEDYKSTVLRRKGPDGETLSNATKSTKLGGGSVVGKRYDDDGYTVSGYTDTATEITEKDGPRRKRGLKEKLLGRHKNERYENEADEDMRAYRKEKPARIGGINAEADGTYYGSDYDTSNPPSYYQQSEMSQVRDYAYEPSRHKSTRRDFSFTPGTEEALSQPPTEHHRTREPSTRRHNRRRERRHHAPPTSSSRQSSPRKREKRSVPGHYTEPLDFSSAPSRSEYQYSNVDTEDTGTRSYHHPIPGLSKGYRRDGGRSRRRDSLSDSDGDETRYS